ncbi:phosphate ABC transporter substrate-binding protein, PhoT family [Luteimonas marina]|uniref:Phosphate ABC transporter substrate-binding protein, PhoT family n=2 Tax=Luteimonas marina TaxID=488485 RepID=A0A5C5TV71_9GAMM|nr:phosphate ABC transporter substrate-binding protein, PhoT family [Luteimonas marina]
MLACLAFAGANVHAAGSDAHAGKSRPHTPGLVEWSAPALPSNLPQTEEEKEAGRRQGRRTPTPELLQPTIDRQLPAYVPTPGVRLSGTFAGGSSDVLVGLVGMWFERFARYHPDVRLSIEPPFAGSLGTKELIKESVDFVFVSRELKPEDLVEFDARFGYAPTSIPISGGSYRHFGFLDAMGFFVHPDNPIRQLSYEQIDAIYSSTRHRGGDAITTWGQLGLTGEWADKKIAVHGIKPWNGFEEFIRQKILDKDGRRGEWRDDIHFEKVVFPLAGNVAGDRYALGYSGLAYIDAPVRMLPLVEVAGSAAVAPTYENVALATYPLTRLVYFNVNKAPGKPLPPALAEFVRFLLSREGQEVVREHGIFLPLRESQAAPGRQTLGD